MEMTKPIVIPLLKPIIVKHREHRKGLKLKQELLNLVLVDKARDLDFRMMDVLYTGALLAAEGLGEDKEYFLWNAEWMWDFINDQEQPNG